MTPLPTGPETTPATPPMRPADIQVIGSELAIRWANGEETYLPLATLRRYCPCAACSGERDVFGNLHKGPDRPLGPRATELVTWTPVGGYAIQPVWGDGHSTGIYAFDYLRRLGAMNQP